MLWGNKEGTSACSQQFMYSKATALAVSGSPNTSLSAHPLWQGIAPIPSPRVPRHECEQELSLGDPTLPKAVLSPEGLQHCPWTAQIQLHSWLGCSALEVQLLLHQQQGFAWLCTHSCSALLWHEALHGACPVEVLLDMQGLEMSNVLVLPREYPSHEALPQPRGSSWVFVPLCHRQRTQEQQSSACQA